MNKKNLNICISMTAGQNPSDEEMDHLVRQFGQLLLLKMNFQSQMQTCIYALLAEIYTERKD